MPGSQAELPRAPRTSTLKSDVFGRIELAHDGHIRRIACGNGFPFTRLIARHLMSREKTALEALAGLEGIPQLLSQTDDVLLRTFIPGAPLSQAHALPENFFDELDALVEAVHSRRVCHNDLHKEQNILVGDDGRPYLLDFQLASFHAANTRTYSSRARDDLRHVEKHRRRYTRDGRGPLGERTFGRGASHRRSLIARIWRKTLKPLYNALLHTLLRRPPSEARRPSTGPWPEWTPPVEPRRTPHSTAR